MNAVILNGARPGEDEVNGVQDALTAVLTDREWDTTPLVLRKIPIAYCQGCFECWVKTPGICKIVDNGRDVARAVIRADLAVFLTPVTFGGYSSELKKALDRIICLVSPFFMRMAGEVHHRPRYRRYPALLGIGVLPQRSAEEERIFATLIRRNAINFHAPAHASGIVYTQQDARTTRAHLDALLQRVVA